MVHSVYKKWPPGGGVRNWRSILLRLSVPGLVILALLGGCGYRHVGYGEGRLTAGGKSIGIPLFVNKSYRSNLEVFLTASLVDEFARRSGGRVVSGNDADLLLSGTVESYVTAPVSYTSFDTIREYRVAITAKAALRERESQRVLWKGEITESQTYPVFSEVSLQQNAEEAAIKEIVRKMAQRVYQKISEDF